MRPVSFFYFGATYISYLLVYFLGAYNYLAEHKSKKRCAFFEMITTVAERDGDKQEVVNLPACRFRTKTSTYLRFLRSSGTRDISLDRRCPCTESY